MQVLGAEEMDDDFAFLQHSESFFALLELSRTTTAQLTAQLTASKLVQRLIMSWKATALQGMVCAVCSPLS